MKVFLAGVDTFLNYCLIKEHVKNAYILESFYTLKKSKEFIPYYKDFLLDSGAFSFFGGAKNANWNEYVKKYINFINENDIKHFFELDIDSIVGYETVLDIRRDIEKNTLKKVIPVFHKSRGVEEYKKMCDNYEYIAIGSSGKHDSLWTRKYPEKLYELVNYAKNKGVKVHGLGYTSEKNLKKIPFYSVDSTSWLSGNKFGSIYKFNGSGICKHQKEKGKRLADAKKVIINNFIEWKKYQEFMDLTY